jgi:hypothetical protein
MQGGAAQRHLVGEAQEALPIHLFDLDLTAAAVVKLDGWI